MNDFGIFLLTPWLLIGVTGITLAIALQLQRQLKHIEKVEKERKH